MLITGIYAGQKTPSGFICDFVLSDNIASGDEHCSNNEFNGRKIFISSFFALIIILCFFAARALNERTFRRIMSFFLSVIIVLSYLTFLRNGQWKNNDTLYMTANNIDGSVLLVNVGNIYANQKNYPEAMWRFKRAIEIRDNNLLAHHNSGLIYLLDNKYDSAAFQFQKALSIDSLFPDGIKCLQMCMRYKVNTMTRSLS